MKKGVQYSMVSSVSDKYYLFSYLRFNIEAECSCQNKTVTFAQLLVEGDNTFTQKINSMSFMIKHIYSFQ